MSILREFDHNFSEGCSFVEESNEILLSRELILQIRSAVMTKISGSALDRKRGPRTSHFHFVTERDLDGKSTFEVGKSCLSDGK